MAAADFSRAAAMAVRHGINMTDRVMRPKRQRALSGFTAITLLPRRCRIRRAGCAACC